jgi:hypothetical protein
MMSRDEELHHELGQLIRKTLQHGALIFPLCNPDTHSS